MLYDVPYEQLLSFCLDDVKTHSLIAKENRLLQYVRNRNSLDLERISETTNKTVSGRMG